MWKKRKINKKRPGLAHLKKYVEAPDSARAFDDSQSKD